MKNLSLVVVDEQQRFGVDQRNLLLKRKPIPNLLAMSATPIPRTLSMTLYGDLSLSTIRTMPNRKRDVKTVWKKNKGYPTKEHKLKIKKFGFSKYHRVTFKSN